MRGTSPSVHCLVTYGCHSCNVPAVDCCWSGRPQERSGARHCRNASHGVAWICCASWCQSAASGTGRSARVGMWARHTQVGASGLQSVVVLSSCLPYSHCVSSPCQEHRGDACTDVLRLPFGAGCRSGPCSFRSRAVKQPQKVQHSHSLLWQMRPTTRDPATVYIIAQNW